MGNGHYRKLSEVIEDLKADDINPDEVLVNEDEVVKANPVFEPEED